MKTSALVLGIIGGLLALGIGVFGYLFGSIISAAGDEQGGIILKFIAIGAPALALLGAGIVKSKGIFGGGIMICAATIFVILVGISMITVIPTLLVGLGGVLGIFGEMEERKSAQVAQHNSPQIGVEQRKA